MICKTPASPPTVTAVVLTKDEAQTIARCLSHLEWADDVVVLDSGSTDATCSIARSLGARVVTHVCRPFRVADQRNYALTEMGLGSTWVLFLDADEICTDAFAQSVRRAVTSGYPVVVFRACPKFMFMDRWLRHTCFYPAWHDRLIRVGYARFTGLGGGGPWERAQPEDRAHGVGYIKEPYLHYSFSKGVSSWLRKHDEYASWAAEDLVKRAHGEPVTGRNVVRRLGDPRDAVALLGTRPVFLFLSPLARFFYTYVLRLGFLDGFPGLIYSLMMSFFQFLIFLKYVEAVRERLGKTM